MGRILGIALFAVALWFLASQYLGTGFGGAASDAEARVAPTQRAHDSVVRAHEEGEERRRKLLGE
jgi:hypothetical protein